MSNNRSNSDDRSTSSITSIDAPDFMVSTRIEVARRVGDHLYIVSSHSDTLDCNTRDQADRLFNTLDKSLSEEVLELRENLDSTPTQRRA